MSRKTSAKISLEGIDPLFIYGHHDSNLSKVEQRFGVKVIARGQQIAFEGEGKDVERVSDLFRELLILVKKGYEFNDGDLLAALEYVEQNPSIAEDAPAAATILSTDKKVIRAKSPGQQAYVEAIRKNDIIFSIGPAGTGKTYLAVAMAISSLKNKEVSRIVLARPAVEAGESLGFLPGDLAEKVDPYLRPLYDALYDMVPAEKLRKLLDMKVIEIVPLAYMRGRTLNDSFVILDEAQNTTAIQMKMFLTRLGIGSKAIITGDITQVDLPDKEASGLIQIQHILADMQGVKFVYLTEKDVVRHRLVQEIIKAYEQYENGQDQSTTQGR